MDLKIGLLRQINKSDIPKWKLKFDIDKIKSKTIGDNRFIRTIFKIPMQSYLVEDINQYKWIFRENSELQKIDKTESEMTSCFGCAELTKSINTIEKFRLTFANLMNAKQRQLIYRSIFFTEIYRFRKSRSKQIHPGSKP